MLSSVPIQASNESLELTNEPSTTFQSDENLEKKENTELLNLPDGKTTILSSENNFGGRSKFGSIKFATGKYRLL